MPISQEDLRLFQTQMSSDTPTLPASVLSTVLQGSRFQDIARNAPPRPDAKPGPYMTALPREEEAQFQDWVKQNKIPWQESPTADYDMRGFWQAQQVGDPLAKRSTTNLHFPDTYKTPYHKTFSNESIYATPDAPRWKGNKLMSIDGKVLVDEG